MITSRKLTEHLARRLRYLADRIDPAHAPRALHWSFTFERGEGIRFREDSRGCRLWYISTADYDRAHTEADSAERERQRAREVAAWYDKMVRLQRAAQGDHPGPGE